LSADERVADGVHKGERREPVARGDAEPDVLVTLRLRRRVPEDPRRGHI